MKAFNKVVRIGTVLEYTRNGSARVPTDVFAKVEYTEDGRLSISGVIGPLSNGDARGSSGQFIMSFREYDERGHMSLSDITPAPEWDVAMVKAFFDAWDAWHMNDMRAGCEHQRAEKWSERPIDPSKPTTAYGKHFQGQQYDSWNMLAWVRPSEHPSGLLGKPCPTCGYKYGTAWLREAVPVDVLAFLRGLPSADKQPAWV